MSRRIELGISLERAARDTNIRARMLEALESGDYSQYPPRGHAIGMLSSYARYLDLDSASIVEVFDSEYEAYSSSREIEKIANNTRRGVGRFGERVIGEKSRPISRESSRSSRSQRKRGGEGEGEGTSKLSRNLKDEAEAKDDERYRSGSVRVVGTRQTGSFRAVRSARGGDTGSFDPARVTPTTRSRTASSRRGTSGRSSRRPSGVDEFTARPTEDLSRSGEERTPNFFGIDVDTGKTAVSHGRRRRPSTRSDVSEQTAGDDGIIARARRIISSIFSERRTRLIAVAVITIVIAIIIAASVLISTAGHGNSGIIPVQGGVVNDTTTTDGENAAHKTITTANGNPVIIKIEVAKGETSLVEVTYDGANAYKGTAVGGQFSREFPVTESFSATFSNPSAVTVTENGNPIEIATNEDGKSGSLYISIQSAPK